MLNIILCGGVGERLWPISRTRHPKQFSRILDGKSLLQHTAMRNRPICDATMVVTNTEQYFMARDQMEEAGVETSFILETVGRNTAPAITLACLTLPAESLVLVTPSDHLVRDLAAYERVLEEGKLLAEAGHLVTFGIQPEWAETGYGYIHADGTQVLSFKEKPDLETAVKYMECGDYFWNSGIFLFRVDSFLSEMNKYQSEVVETSRNAIHQAEKGLDFLRVLESSMLAIPRISVDYAVMEKSSLIRMVPSVIQWSDLGSFESLYDVLEADSQGNVFVGGSSEKSFINIGAKDNFIYSESKRVAAIDISQLMIVDTRDALLVGLMSSSQKVKEVVEVLKAEGSRIKDFHETEYRPWGHYTTLFQGERYKIRTMMIKPGNRLGKHMHVYRNEHWVVVQGQAQVEVGQDVRTVCLNESTYIPAGEMHRILNSGTGQLVMIEVQSGDMVDETDIIRA